MSSPARLETSGLQLRAACGLAAPGRARPPRLPQGLARDLPEQRHALDVVAVDREIDGHAVESHPHGLGDALAHGVGIGANEPPYIGETLPGAPTYEFKPGMCFAVEPLVWIDGVRGGGGVRLEEQVLVTEDGPHVMSRAPFDEKLILTS